MAAHFIPDDLGTDLRVAYARGWAEGAKATIDEIADMFGIVRRVTPKYDESGRIVAIETADLLEPRLRGDGQHTVEPRYDENGKLLEVVTRPANG